ncbi:hypothetical protein [Streptomyces mirabilis]|uniref:hypothetical protein n=1 Tax=Streptomyces mirabilis TaxID=68239 RepID=UPI0033295B57
MLTRATDRTERPGSAEVKTTMDKGPGSTPATMTGTYSWRGGYAFDVVTAAEAVDMQDLTASATVRAGGVRREGLREVQRASRRQQT